MGRARDALGRFTAATEDADDAATGLGEELDATGDNAENAGEKIEEAGKLSARSLREAKGEAGLLGEMFGIHLPRHVRSFVAELPGVGSALQAAFAATAVLFLIEALVKGSEKLSEWISNTFIFTQAMKDGEQAVKDQNKTLLALAEQLDKDTEALARFGKTQGELKSDKVKELREEIAKNLAEFEKASKAAKDYATNANATVEDKLLEKTEQLGGFLGTVAEAYVRIALGEKHVFDSIESFFTGSKTPTELAEETRKAGLAAQATTIETAQKIKDEKVQLTLAEKEALAQSTSDQLEAANRAIAIQQMVGQAQIRRWAALATYQAMFAKDSAAAVIRVQQEAAEKEYQLKLQTLQKERAAEEQAAHGFKAAGDNEKYQKEIQAVTQTNAKIEVLNADHDARLLHQAQEFEAKFRQIEEQVRAIRARAFVALPDEVQNFQKLADAASRLGVTLANDLGKNATTAKNDLALLAKELAAGHIALRDYQQAEIKALETQIAFDKQMGKSPALVAAEEKQLEKLRTEFDKMYPELKKVEGFWDTFTADFKKKAKEVEGASGQMGQMVAMAAAQMQKSFESAMAGALLSEQSFGAAIEKATAQILAQIAAQSAMWALYYLAMGVADTFWNPARAGADFTAAAEFGALAAITGAAAVGLNGAGGSSSGSKAGAPTAGGGGGNVQLGGGGGSGGPTGVTKLAAGGLVSSPTVIMAGDSPSGGAAPEAIIPLSDPSAMSQIADALLSASALRRVGASMTVSTAMAAAASVGSSLPQGSAKQQAASLRDNGHTSSGGDVHIHMPNLKGTIGNESIKKVMKVAGRMVKNRQLTLNASNSQRITRRSQ